jgi:AraC family transcriptional regulator
MPRTAEDKVLERYEQRILRVVDYIHAHPGGDLTLDALADVAALSRFHFHRVFHAVTGETAAQTVRRLRMNKASYALAMTTTPLPRVARDVGYDNVASFTRAFRESFGMSPAAFRQRGEWRPFYRNPPKEMIMTQPVEIRQEPARRLACVAHRGAYHDIGQAFEKLYTLMVTRQLGSHAGQMIGVYYDDPSAVPLADLRSHAGFVLPDDMPITSPLEEVILPAGRQAVLTHIGPYAGLPAAYDQLFALWLPKSGEEPGLSPTFEVYLNSPMEVSQEDLRTEIHLPLLDLQPKD